MIALFGKKSFSVSLDKIYTFDGIKMSARLNTDKQDNNGRKPSTYIKGVDLASFNITVRLDINQGVHPMNELEDWMDMLNQKKAYYFLLGGKPFMNTRFLLVDVTSSDEILDNQGNILSMELSLKFDEFVRAGTVSKQGNTNSVYPALKPRDKEELKISKNFIY
ncbi:MAG: hypothetical protein FH761_17910 [Firmicutes bacterium]|nr:hypothetical protein [Bacillota bacterium]